MGGGDRLQVMSVYEPITIGSWSLLIGHFSLLIPHSSVVMGQIVCHKSQFEC